MSQRRGGSNSLDPVPRRRFWEPLGVAVLLSVFLVQCLVFIFTTSFTYDETRYAAVGKHLMHARPWTVEVATARHPPLSYYLSGLGLVDVAVPDDVWQIDDAAERGKQVVLAVGQRIVYRSRLPMLLLGVVLGLVLYAWSRRCWGRAGALLSLFLFAFSPNLIAHQSLITPDFAVTTFLFLTAWCFDSLCRDRRNRWALATGAAAGLALLSKFTALFLVPLSLVWLAVDLACHRRGDRRRFLVQFATIGAIAGLVVLVGYQFQPMLFLKGARYQLAVSQGEWTGYLMGELSKRGWWYYYLVAVLVKVPVAALVIAVLAIAARVRTRQPIDATTEVILLSTAAFFLVYLSLFSRLNIGLRYLLPAFPFVLVWVGQAVRLTVVDNALRAGSASDRSGWGARFRSRLVDDASARWGATLVFAVLAVWQVVSVGRAAPHYLAYFNEIVGGPEHGAYWLGDSNLDWGQDLKGLADYVKSHNLHPVCVRYFGTMPPEVYGLERCGDGPLEEGAIQAVSVSLIQGLYLNDPERFAHFRDEKLIETIGYTIRLYRTD